MRTETESFPKARTLSQPKSPQVLRFRREGGKGSADIVRLRTVGATF
jgi:hypothetical protein